MKNLSIKNLLWSNLLIKCCSLIIGFSLWSFLSQWQSCTIQCKAPICFIQKSARHITSPECVNVTLVAQRAGLSTFDLNSISFHLNEHDLHEGKNKKILSEKELFLPPYINMVDCNPRIIELLVEA